jgi:hypothetical protein
LNKIVDVFKCVIVDFMLELEYVLEGIIDLYKIVDLVEVIRLIYLLKSISQQLNSQQDSIQLKEVKFI